MRSLLGFVIGEAAVVAIGAALISIGYTIVLPRYFDDMPTPSVMIVGLALVAMGSAYVAHRRLPTTSWPGRLGVVSISLVATLAAFLVAMFVILNTRGG